MPERECEFPYESYNIHPYKIFISHSEEDNDISQIIADILLGNKFLPYIAERESIGKPLIAKLRDELIDSDAILVIWTINSCKKTACEIIGFETGMAWANHLKIFIIKAPRMDITWFYEQLTDYIEVDTDQIKLKQLEVSDIIKGHIDKLNFKKHINPICFAFPRMNNAKNNSRNEDCVAKDGTINLKSPFDDILVRV